MDKIKKILDENKSLKILGPVLILAVIIMAIIYIPQLGSKSPSNTNATNGIAVSTPVVPVDLTPVAEPTIIPGEIPTDFSPGTDTSTDPSVVEDTSLVGPPEYKGATKYAGGILVSLQFSNITKILKIGESIAGYKLKSVADDSTSIVLEKDNRITVLQQSPNSN